MFIFDSVRFLSKKVTKVNFFKKQTTETDSNRPVSVWFFRTKTGSNRFGSVFSGLARFFGFGSVFSGLARFFDLARFVWFWLGLVRFFPVFSVRFFLFQA